MSRSTRAALAGLLLLLTAACAGADEVPGAAEPGRSPDPTPTATDEPSATASDEPTDEPTVEPTGPASPGVEPLQPGAEEPLPPVRNRTSLPALMRESVQAGRVRRTQPLAETDRWRSWAVTYTVDGATVSGELLVPRGRGPFPAVVLNHGYIDPAVYVLGQGLSREQEWLAANGFVVLHTDYRGHAGSDPVSDLGREARLVYARDAIGAVRALEKEPYVDPDRLAMLGRSMGGGVTYNALVAEPGLVDAAVVFAPVSSLFVDNLRQFTEPNRPDEAVALYERFGTPAESPRFYRDLSSRSYFDRITEPVLVLHGTADDTCPIRWSDETVRAMRRAGVDVDYQVYEGEGHAFGPRYEDSMRRTVAFLRAELGIPPRG